MEAPVVKAAAAVAVRAMSRATRSIIMNATKIRVCGADSCAQWTASNQFGPSRPTRRDSTSAERDFETPGPNLLIFHFCHCLKSQQVRTTRHGRSHAPRDILRSRCRATDTDECSLLSVDTEAHSHTRATRRSAHALLASRELARPVPHGTSPAPDARAPTRALKPQTAQSPKTPPPLALPSQIDRHQPRSTRTHTRPSTPPPPPHAATRRRRQTHAVARRTPPPDARLLRAAYSAMKPK